MAVPACDWLRHFQCLLHKRWTEFEETLQDFYWSENKQGRLSLWLVINNSGAWYAGTCYKYLLASNFHNHCLVWGDTRYPNHTKNVSVNQYQTWSTQCPTNRNEKSTTVELNYQKFYWIIANFTWNWLWSQRNVHGIVRSKQNSIRKEVYLPWRYKKLLTKLASLIETMTRKPAFSMWHLDKKKPNRHSLSICGELTLRYARVKNVSTNHEQVN